MLSLAEAPEHPHNVARGAFIDLAGVPQPAPAPRYSSTRCDPPRPPRREGEDGEAILAGLGYSQDEVAALRRDGALL